MGFCFNILLFTLDFNTIPIKQTTMILLTLCIVTILPGVAPRCMLPNKLFGRAAASASPSSTTIYDRYIAIDFNLKMGAIWNNDGQQPFTNDQSINGDEITLYDYNTKMVHYMSKDGCSVSLIDPNIPFPVIDPEKDVQEPSNNTNMEYYKKIWAGTLAVSKRDCLPTSGTLLLSEYGSDVLVTAYNMSDQTISFDSELVFKQNIIKCPIVP